MKNKHTILTALACLLMLALGACLWLAGEGMLRAGGVHMETVQLPEGKARLYRPETIRAQSVPLMEEPSGGAHAPEESVMVGGQCAAALLLADGFDGADALAVELSRRGVAVLLPGKVVPAREAWDWLMEQSFTRVSSVALIASKGRSAEALALGEALVPTDRAAATTMLLGDDALLSAAVSWPGRNLLILTRHEADTAVRAAFLGTGDGRSEFGGYFSEGTARAAASLGGALRWSSREALVRVLDWQGSSLGHAVSLSDDDFICGYVGCCRIAAALCLPAAALLWFLRRKMTEQ